MRLFAESLLASISISLIALTAPCSQAGPKGSPPTVTFSYAQEKIRQGEIWRVYIAANDPDGDMSRIVCTIEQSGGQSYRPSITPLKKEMGGKFAGYLALYTSSNLSLWGGVTLQLTLTILDREGNESEPLVFPLEFNGEPAKPLPPDAEKDLNRRIGNINIDLTRRDAS